MGAAPIGTMTGTMITRYLNHFFDKRSLLVFGTVGWALCQLVPPILRLLGLFFKNGTQSLFYTILSVTFFAGFIVSQATVSGNSLMADIADEHEYDTGRRQEGIFFGALSFSGKASAGLGTFFAGFGLSFIGWEATKGMLPGEIPADMLFRLGVLYGPVVGLLAAIGIFSYSRVKLTRTRHAEILQELWRRRSVHQPDHKNITAQMDN